MTDDSAPTILILAGKRDGALDPLAARAGVSHKCLVPIHGRALLSWVLEAAGGAWSNGRIVVSIHDASVVAGLPEVQELVAAGRLAFSESQDGLLESIEAVVAEHPGCFPLLITTGDNVLATPESLRACHDGAVAQRADALLAIAEKEAILAAHPDAQRFFYEFRDRGIANCNTYWLGSDRALAAAEAFRGGGQFMKGASRIASAFGIANLIGFRFGWFTLDRALERMSQRFGVKVAAHIYDDGAYSVDVDNERTYRVCEELLAKRKAERIPAGAQ